MRNEPEHLPLSDKQQAIIEAAIAAIRPFNKERNPPNYGYYFTLDGDDSSEYDCCDSDECMKKAQAELKKRYPKKKIEALYGSVDNDESFNSCYVCDRYLDWNLNGMEQEFNHHKRHSRTYEVLTSSRTAFCIENMLEAFPTYEYGLGGYHYHQKSLGNSKPYNDALKRQKAHYRRVVRYASHIIKTLA
jgi:hypothetical protein